MVDLDGAKAGWPVNLDAVRSICQVPGVEVELGGGLRTLPDIERVLALGVKYVVLGTAAVERLGLVEQACRGFPGRVRAGIDARNGEVKVAGWLSGTGLTVAEVGRRVKAAGVELVEYTDVGRDGVFAGVDAAGAAKLAAEAGVQVVASGGVGPAGRRHRLPRRRAGRGHRGEGDLRGAALAEGGGEGGGGAEAVSCIQPVTRYRYRHRAMPSPRPVAPVPCSEVGERVTVGGSGSGFGNGNGGNGRSRFACRLSESSPAST